MLGLERCLSHRVQALWAQGPPSDEWFLRLIDEQEMEPITPRPQTPCCSISKHTLNSSFVFRSHCQCESIGVHLFSCNNSKHKFMHISWILELKKRSFLWIPSVAKLEINQVCRVIHRERRRINIKSSHYSSGWAVIKENIGEHVFLPSRDLLRATWSVTMAKERDQSAGSLMGQTPHPQLQSTSMTFHQLFGLILWWHITSKLPGWFYQKNLNIIISIFMLLYLNKASRTELE